MRNGASKSMALGGILAALALVIMCLGGLIPIATYVCPMLCAILGSVVLRICGAKIAWAWYAAVAILSLLLGPDKEAAAVYLFFGYYPLLKSHFDKVRFGWVLKALFFNLVILVLYSLLIYVMGMAQLAVEHQELGLFGLFIMLILGNITFFLLDGVLSRMARRR